MEFVDLKNFPSNGKLRISGDWQVGATGHVQYLVEEVLRPIGKNHRLALIGDLIDAITVKDNRFSWEDLDEKHKTPLDQLQHVENVLRPKAEYIDLIGTGNHELTLSAFGDVTRMLSSNLGVSYGGYQALVRINEKTKMILWHGRPPLTSRVSSAIERNMSIKRSLVRYNRQRWDAEDIRLYAQGHTNQLLVVNPYESQKIEMEYDFEKKDFRAKYVNEDAAWYACCGSLQRLYVPGKTTYAEAKGYSPLPLGCVDVHFKNSEIVYVEPVILG